MLTSAHAALVALPATPSADLRAALRAVDRAADDGEAAISEVSGGAAAALSSAVASARAAANAARSGARRAAREEVAAGRRAELLDGGDEDKRGREEGAAKVADDITAGLRRVTGIVQEEIDRTVATAGVVDDSSRVLGKTRDVHVGYGEGIDSGAETLQMLMRDEKRANCFLGTCFVAFFLVAVFIAHRRVSKSNTATFIVRPIYRVATFVPRKFARISRALVGAVFGSGSKSKGKERRSGKEVKVIAESGEGGGRQTKPPEDDKSKLNDKWEGVVNGREGGDVPVGEAEIVDTLQDGAEKEAGVGEGQLAGPPPRKIAIVKDEVAGTRKAEIEYHPVEEKTVINSKNDSGDETLSTETAGTFVAPIGGEEASKVDPRHVELQANVERSDEQPEVKANEAKTTDPHASSPSHHNPAIDESGMKPSHHLFPDEEANEDEVEEGHAIGEKDLIGAGIDKDEL